MKALFYLSVLFHIAHAQVCEPELALTCRTKDGTPCDQLTARTTDCIETIFWDLEVSNRGSSSPMKVDAFDLTLHNEQTLMLVLSLPVNPIVSSTGMSPREDINLCQSVSSYSASLSAVATVGSASCNANAEYSFYLGQTMPMAAPPVSVPTRPSPITPPTTNNGDCQVICAPGFVCSTQGTSCLRIGAPTPRPPITAPVPVPVPMPAPVPITVPVPIAVPVNAPPVNTPSVDCTLTATIDCRLANNAPCNTLVPRTTNCQETLFYTVSFQNNGDVPLTPTTANLLADGESIALTLPGELFVGQSATATASTMINVCGTDSVEFSANVQIRSNPPNGVVCRPPSPPPPQPIPQPTPIVAPVPFPTFNRVDCTVVPEIQCVLSDGRPCGDIVSRTSNCAETFRYVLSVRNAGSAILSVTTANIITDGVSTSFVSSLGPNPIPVGEIATAAQEVTVDVCGSFQFSTMIDVSVDPTDDANVCNAAIPQPTTINIGDPSSPVMAPLPTVMAPLPAMPTVMAPTVMAPTVVAPTVVAPALVDCNIVSTLESCTLADNSACSSLQVAPGQCDVELFFNVRLENAGSVELTVTDGNLVSSGETIDFVPSIPSNPLSIGQVAMVAVPILVDVCQGAQISASIDVEAIPPPGFICR